MESPIPWPGCPGYIRKLADGTGEMIQQLRAHTALVENLSLDLRIHIRWLTVAWLSLVPGGSDASAI